MDENKKLQSSSNTGNCFNDRSLGAATNGLQRSLSASSSGSSDSGSSSSSSSDGDGDGDSDSSDNENACQDMSVDPENVGSKAEGHASFKTDEHFRKKYLGRVAIEFKSEWSEFETDSAAAQPSLLRVPNFMPFDQKPYDVFLYKNMATQEDLIDSASREAFLTKLKTTVRWREIQNKATGELIKESNARIVRWSDGSQTFHVGAEAFHVVPIRLSGDMNKFYLRSGNYYKAHCPINEKLTLRPKLESDFGKHRMQGMRERAIYKPATSGVKILTDLTANPVVERERRIREESAHIRTANQRQRYSSVQPLQNYSAYRPNYNK